MRRIRLERIGAIAVAVIDTPPGHMPDATARRELISLAHGPFPGGEPAALVLFCTGEAVADDTPQADPGAEDGLYAACKALEDMDIPVIMGLRGAIESGGAELALAAHFRLSEPDVTLCWPDIHLGRIAGGGGVVRLARIAGAEQALEILLSGTRISASQAAEAGIVDGMVQGDLIEAAVGLAGQLAEAGAKPRPSSGRSDGLADTSAFRAACAARREAGNWADNTAEAHLLDCVEAALVLPVEAALAMELAASRELAAGPRARALAHLHRAEQVASRPDLTAIRPLRAIALHHTDDLAAPLARNLLAAGCHVTLSEPDPALLQSVLSRIGTALAGDVSAGRLDAKARRAQLSRLRSAVDPDDLSGCDLLIAGGPVSPAPTGSPPITAMLSHGFVAPDFPTSSNAAPAFGLHPVLGGARRDLVEILPPDGADPSDIAAIRDLAQLIGMMPVVAAPGVKEPITARLAAAVLRVAEQLLEDGATPRQVDQALEQAGHATGPFRMADREGLAPVAVRRRRMAARRDPRDRYVTILDRLCEAGRLGQAVGRGFHDYPEGIPEGVASAAVEHLIDESRDEAGLSRRAISSEDIVLRCEMAYVLEGIRLLQEGDLRETRLLDLVACQGLGFPRELGGPMYHAATEGLGLLRERLDRLAREEDARLWAVPPYLDRLIARDDTLSR